VLQCCNSPSTASSVLLRMRSVWAAVVSGDDGIWLAMSDAVACSAAAARLSEPRHPPTSTSTSSKHHRHHCRHPPPHPTPLPQLLISTPALNPTTLPLSHSLLCVCTCVWSLLVIADTHHTMNPQPIMFIQSQLLFSLCFQHWPFFLQSRKTVSFRLKFSHS